MPSPGDERLDIISAAIGTILRRQDEFDRRLKRIEASVNLDIGEPVAAEPIHVSAPLSPQPLPEVAPLPPPPPPPPVPVAARPPTLETNIGLTWVNRIGAVTLVVGIGFLFKWASDNQWIGPGTRVVLGLLAAAAVLGLADLLWRRGQHIFAQGVTATGISILYLSIYAAFGFYKLIPQPLAFVAMALATAVAGALSLRYGSIAIAALGLLGGFLTPPLLSSGEVRPWFLFGYLLLLDLGAMGLARMRQWRPLEALSFAGTAFLYAGWLSSMHARDHAPATVYLLIFYALFACTRLQPVFLILQALAAAAPATIWESDAGPFLTLTFVLAAAGLAVASIRRWKFAVSVSFAAYWLCYAVWAAEWREAKPTGVFLAGITAGWLLFYAWLPWWTGQRREPVRSQDLAVFALNGGAYFGAAYALLNPDFHAWMGLFAVALAAIYLASGGWLWKRRGAGDSLTPVLLALGVAMTLLTLAVPIQFTGYRITMAWSLEAAALTWIGARAANRTMQLTGAGIFLLVAFRLFAIDAWIYSNPAGFTPIWNERFLTFALAAVCLWLAAWWLRTPFALIEYLGGHAVLLWTLTQELLDWAVRTKSAGDLRSAEAASVSILYAVYAVVLIGVGVGTRSAVNRIAGLALIGFVVLKLYLYDVWQLSRLYQTLAFVALGILLLSTSFLYSRFRGLIENWWRK